MNRKSNQLKQAQTPNKADFKKIDKRKCHNIMTLHLRMLNTVPKYIRAELIEAKKNNKTKKKT